MILEGLYIDVPILYILLYVTLGFLLLWVNGHNFSHHCSFFFKKQWVSVCAQWNIIPVTCYIKWNIIPVYTCYITYIPVSLHHQHKADLDPLMLDPPPASAVKKSSIPWYCQRVCSSLVPPSLITECWLLIDVRVLWDIVLPLVFWRVSVLIDMLGYRHAICKTAGSFEPWCVAHGTYDLWFMHLFCKSSGGMAFQSCTNDIAVLPHDNPKDQSDVSSQWSGWNVKFGVGPISARLVYYSNMSSLPLNTSSNGISWQMSQLNIGPDFKWKKLSDHLKHVWCYNSTRLADF